VTHHLDDRGSVSAFVAVIAIALVAVAGLVYDGGQILNAQARARDLAANAARAGAQEIDLDVLRAEQRVVLDPDRATSAAHDYLAQHGATGIVDIDGSRVTVTATLRQPLRILPGADRDVAATDSADAVPGLLEGELSDA
jgi:Flp pilus assembly protein TadG